MHLFVLLHCLGGTHRSLDYIKEQLQQQHDIIVKAPDCLVNKTHLGILACSQILYEWLLHELEGITMISFIGHSVGGLYARSCIALLYQNDIIPTVIPMNYITLASPHLGTLNHRYLGSMQDFVIRNVVKNTTMLELTFADSKTVSEMAMFRLTTEMYVKALGLFENLIVYANTSDLTCHFLTSGIMRKHLDLSNSWPDIISVPDQPIVNVTCFEDELFNILNRLPWKRFAVFPKSTLLAHGDIIVGLDFSIPNGAHIIQHLVDQLVGF